MLSYFWFLFGALCLLFGLLLVPLGSLLAPLGSLLTPLGPKSKKNAQIGEEFGVQIGLHFEPKFRIFF